MSTKSDTILNAAHSVLLVDWPSGTLPRGLICCGLRVYGYSPNAYSFAQLFEEKPEDPNIRCFSPTGSGERGFLAFQRMEHAPTSVDVVCAYRPSEELPEIIKKHVEPLGAKMLWLQPPVTSAHARDLASELGVECVEGVDLADEVLRLRGKRPEMTGVA